MARPGLNRILYMPRPGLHRMCASTAVGALMCTVVENVCTLRLTVCMPS